MKPVLHHLKVYTLRGLLAIIPIALSYFAIRILYLVIDKRVITLVKEHVGFTFPGLGIILVVITLYVLGLIASNVVGKRIFGFIEWVTNRIPLIKTTYQVGKQLSVSLSLPEKQVFKRAVLVEYLKPGIWTVGFVTGTVMDRTDNEEYLKVYVPTPPNPTSGTIMLVRESQTRDPGWTIEEALRTVISGGIIGPTAMR